MNHNSPSPPSGPRVAQPHLLDSLWSVPLATAAAAFLSTVGVSNYGLFYVVYMNHYGVTREEASWPGSIHCIISHVIAIGSGTMVIMLSVYNAVYFMKYRGLATGFKFVGWSLSGLAFPPILTVLFQTYGFRGGMLVLSGIVMNVMVFIMLLNNPRPFICCASTTKANSHKESASVVHEAEKVRPRPENMSNESQSKPPETHGLCRVLLCSAIAPLKAPIFYAFLPSFVLCDYGDMLLSTTIVDYAVDKGFTAVQAKNLIICISLAGLLGRILLPLAADRGYLRRSALVALCYFAIALACMALPHAQSVASVWFLCFVAAAQFGCILTMKNVLVADYLGIENIAAAMGATGVAMLPLLLGNPSIVEDESCPAVVEAMGEKVDYAISSSDIDIASLVPGK
ncbi:hypothetical protein HPB50_001861 [Hyalomma asiaticum]|uniref:Uncharacterized protein n=1 Tax=Hyalomma asiaticum TaxID=266040 RepID=A0ACB7SDG7_HYAAI|nr:hypothetical protein HPB50_001861 [Hyalomma asiaticum]